MSSYIEELNIDTHRGRHTYILGGARGVTVVVIENGLDN